MLIKRKELQKEIIGTLLTFPEEFHVVADILNVSDFDGIFNPVASIIYAENGADLVSVASKTKIDTNTLVEWQNGSGLKSQLKAYCEHLKDLNARNIILELSQELKSLVQSDMVTNDILDFAEDSILSVSPQHKKEPVKVGDALADVFKVLEKRNSSENKIVGIPTGIEDLDLELTGLRNGNLIIIAARPGMGKTALAGNIATNAARLGNTTLVFSMEMTVEEMTERLIAETGSVNYGRLRSGDFHSDDWSRMFNSADILKDIPLYVDDSSSVSLQEIKTKCRAMKAKNGLGLVIVDYLTLMTLPKSDRRDLSVGSVANGLKRMAKELDVPVVLLCQLSRAVEQRENKRPIKSDLRDSGEIEQDANVILFPFRESSYCDKCRDGIDNAEHNLEQHKRKAEIIIGKNRAGKENVSIPAEFIGEYQRFKGVEKW